MLGTLVMPFNELAPWIIATVGWTLAIVLFFVRRADHRRAAGVDGGMRFFMEISQLVDRIHRVTDMLETSYIEGKPREQRKDPWEEYRAIQKTLADNRTRYEFLLERYFGSRIRGIVQRMIHDTHTRYGRHFGELLPLIY
jgi:hypothetical protein